MELKEYYNTMYNKFNKTTVEIAKYRGIDKSTVARQMKKLGFEFTKRKGKGRYNWKGNAVSYREIHKWINRYKPKPEYCIICNEKKKLEACNISGEYKRDLNDFLYCCRSCHRLLDKLWGRR